MREQGCAGRLVEPDENWSAVLETLVANLGLLGYRLRLHDRDEARIARVRERGGLDVEGLAKGFAPLELVTPQLAPAVDGTDVIVVVTGSHFYADVARSLAGVLRDGQSILLIQGGTGGSLIVRRELRAAGCRAAVDVSEMDNYPYSLGWPEPTRVKLTIVKRFLQIAALPASRVEMVLGPLQRRIPAGGGRAQYPHHLTHQHERNPARGEHGGQHRPPRG